MTARTSYLLPVIGTIFTLAVATLFGCASSSENANRHPANPHPPRAIHSGEGFSQTPGAPSGQAALAPAPWPDTRSSRAGGDPVAVESAVRGLLALAGVDPVATNVTVNKGWVTVEGSASDAVDREQLMRAIANTQGVRAVADELRLVSAASEERLTRAEAPITSWFDWLAGPLAIILATAALVALYLELRVIPKLATAALAKALHKERMDESIDNPRTSIATAAALPAKSGEDAAAKRAA